MRLSVIDIHSPRDIPEIARSIEIFGYHTLWTTEHYSPSQSASPLVVAALAAASTSKIMVGCAGVMMRYVNAYMLAQDVRVIGNVFPGRFRFGAISGRATHPAVHKLLTNERPSDRRSHEEKIHELRRYLLPNSSSQTRNPGPAIDRPMPIWLCGLSRETALFAAENGFGLIYHEHIAKVKGLGANHGPDVLKLYCDKFTPGPELRAPSAAVVCYGMCADTPEAARDGWPKDITPEFMGSPAEVVEQLLQTAERFMVPEVIVKCVTARSVEQKILGYKLMAEALINATGQAMERKDRR